MCGQCVGLDRCAVCAVIGGIVMVSCCCTDHASTVTVGWCSLLPCVFRCSAGGFAKCRCVCGAAVICGRGVRTGGDSARRDSGAGGVGTRVWGASGGPVSCLGVCALDALGERADVVLQSGEGPNLGLDESGGDEVEPFAANFPFLCTANVAAFAAFPRKALSRSPAIVVGDREGRVALEQGLTLGSRWRGVSARDESGDDAGECDADDDAPCGRTFEVF